MTTESIPVAIDSMVNEIETTKEPHFDDECTLIGIFGDRGSGKTLGATITALARKDKPIYSNYEIKDPRYRELEPEKLNDIFEPCTVIMDEAYIYIESRQSGRDVNLYFTYILFQIRKRGMTIILTSQLLSPLDLRYRHMLNYVILATKTKKGFRYKVKKNSIYHRRHKTVLLPFENAKKIYPLYDSWQPINPIDSDLVSSVTMQTNPESMNENVEEISQQIMKQFEGRKITKGFVKDWLLKNKLPLNNTDYVYARIKSKEP